MDEAQLEVTKDLVKFKIFESKEIAKAWKQKHEQMDNKLYSNVGEIDGKVFVGYSIAGELASRAIKQAGEYYKLRIDLSAGYDIGRNWAECH